MSSQGLRFVTDSETGRTYPIPEGGSGNEAPPPSDGGVDPAPEPAPSTDTVTQTGTEVQPDGQGFLEPYLADLPEDQRSVVAPVLEKYRQDADANFNKRFTQLQEQAKVPTTIYESLIDDPIQTLNWIADRFQEERGLDIRQQLLQEWADIQQEIQEQNPNEPNKALTQEDIDRILEEREKAKEQQQKQQEFQRRQQEQMNQQINSWVDDAAKKFSLPLTDLEDKNMNDPLRTVIIMQANALHEQGIAKGQAAIEVAAETISKRLSGTNGGSTGNGKQPTTATGGTPPPAEPIDVMDSKQRQARMLEMFSGPPDN